MPKTSREVIVVETGISAAATNIAIDRHWLVEHAQGQRPNLLRFYRNLPAAVIGHYQSADHEVRLDFCERHDIAVARRNTGGGTLYVDEQQLSWSLIVHRPRKWRELNLAQLLEILCADVGNALRQLGLNVQFKAPNDLEIEGRKIASGYVVTLGGSLLFHGMILCDVDIARALQALRVPTEKLSPEGLAGARQRLTTLTEQLGTSPPIRRLKALLVSELLKTCGLAPRNATKTIYAALRQAGQEHWDSAFPDGIPVAPSRAAVKPRAEAVWKCPGGLLRVRLGFDADSQRLSSVSIKGDVFVQPVDLLFRLEHWLHGSALTEVEQRLRDFFELHHADMPGVTPQDVLRALQLALNRLGEQRHFGLTRAQANCLMVLGADDDLSAPDILQRAEIMLVPYCAKPVDCTWRNRDGCPECGRCEVGDAYRLGRTHGLRIVTINNYEHLRQTLGELKDTGVRGLIGMCCQNFFIKRNQAFKDSGIPMVLMDISGSNCYELGQEEQAYAGTFQAQAKLDVGLLQQVMRRMSKTDTPQDQTSCSLAPEGLKSADA